MVAAMEVQKIHDVKEMLIKARKMEEESIRDYNIWANETSNNNDFGSRKVFEGLIEKEERHFDQFDIEIANMEKFGDNYLALQSIEGSKSRTAGGEE
jgi:bacterioferritin